MKKEVLSHTLRWQSLGIETLNPNEIDEIHCATLEILSYVGVNMYSAEALRIMAESGADVDFVSHKVRIPPHIVEDAIMSAPSSVILAARNHEQDVYMGGKRVHFTNFGAGCKVLDLEDESIHASTKVDVEETAIICDALDSVDIYSSAVVATDMPCNTAELYEAEAFLSHTSKHCQHLHLSDGFGARKYFEMGAALAGGWEALQKRPIISSQVCPSSPLQFHKGTCEIIVESAKAHIPINILSMVMSGATAPITLAGTLVVHNAEVLAGIVLHQATRKGAPVIYGSSSTSFDLHLLTAPVGSPELGMISAAVAKLANYYLLPSHVGGT